MSGLRCPCGGEIHAVTTIKHRPVNKDGSFGDYTDKGEQEEYFRCDTCEITGDREEMAIDELIDELKIRPKETKC